MMWGKHATVFGRRCGVNLLRRLHDNFQLQARHQAVTPASTLRRFTTSTKIAGAVTGALLCSLSTGRGQSEVLNPGAIHSVSGQFVASRNPDDSPSSRRPAIWGNTNLVHLEPALLAVAAERFKIGLWQQCGLDPRTPWTGRIFLVVHPARSAGETVAITSSPFLNHWNYRVDFPDTLTQSRYTRALSAVLLLEIANRGASSERSAELPPWLVDGLARQVVETVDAGMLLSAPNTNVAAVAVTQTGPAMIPEGIALTRVNRSRRGLDPLASARAALQNSTALTFDELSWPTDEQMDGGDGGAYFASAQLFQSELFRLKNGPEKMRAFLAELPAHWNWQTAFFSAFHEDFQRPLDVEKWWSLRVVSFATRAPGPQWTTDASRHRLAELAGVPVEFRNGSNALPAHAVISLQAALKSLEPEQRDRVVRVKMRDLSLNELRLATPFGDLAEGYRQALADFLGEQPKRAPVPAFDTHSPPMMTYQATLAETLKRLDALDRRRREAEARAVIPLPVSSKPDR